MNTEEARTAVGRSKEAPDLLRAAEGYEDCQACLRSDTLRLALDFGHQFRLQPEEAVAALLLTASHSLGESLQIELPHGDISPPFHLLAVTPESVPVWTGVPLRYLGGGIEKHVERGLFLHWARRQACEKEEALVRAALTELWLQRANEAAGWRMLRQIADTVVCDQVRPPFRRPPIDRAVSLTTPRRGLLRALSGLTPFERLCLEDSLLGAQRLRSDGSASGPPGKPSFFWHLPEADARVFFRQHGGWLAGIPFVMVRCAKTGFPCLDANTPVVRQFDRLGEVLFEERHSRSGCPRVFRLDVKTGKVVMRFLDRAASLQAMGGESAPLQWVAELGLKFALTLMRLEEASQPDARLVRNGLELAKFYARRRIELLAAFDFGKAADSAETADLDDLELRVFLRICEAGAITRADLRKSFHRMLSSERDTVVARLLSMGLIRTKGRHLTRNAA